MTSAAGLTIGSLTLDNTFAGTVTPTGNNTVTGLTTISGAALKITHLGVATSAVAATDLGSSAVTINSGGLLYIDDDGTGAAGAWRDDMLARLAYVRAQVDPVAAVRLVVSDISAGRIQDEAVISVVH